MFWTFLVIEADQHDGESVVQMLRGESNRVFGCTHPLDAIRFVDKSVDLVICDLAIDRNRAWELLRLWKQRPETPPFLFLIDAGDVRSAVDAMKLGASDCLTKPLDSAGLTEVVTQLLGQGESAERSRPFDTANGTDLGTGPNPLSNGRFDIPAGTSLEDLERVAVQQALEQHRGNRTHAARELGISVRTLQRKLKAWRPPILPLNRCSAGGNTLRPWY